MARIQGRWAKAMKWLHYGLQSEAAWEEAYWNCVWLYVEPDIKVLLEIRNRINGDTPPTDEQYSVLNKHMRCGYPQGYRITHDSGKGKTYELVLEPESTKGRSVTLTTIASLVLAQPAFRLAGDLQRRWSKPRFVRKCRAPSCGKLFYTGRENATACPSRRLPAKADCGNEWVRYKRYLSKIGKNPETDWNNQQLQEEFISYDNS